MREVQRTADLRTRRAPPSRATPIASRIAPKRAKLPVREPVVGKVETVGETSVGEASVGEADVGEAVGDAEVGVGDGEWDLDRVGDGETDVGEDDGDLDLVPVGYGEWE
ncbi:hypothetical protein [Hamadaea flava]|nr:hypothetical protein [Hamadaea flava]